MAVIDTRITNRIRRIRTKIGTLVPIKRLIRSALNRYKWVISSEYRRELERLKKTRTTYQNAEKLRGSGRVLIICEATIPQCYKYRVKQRQEALEHIGVASTCLPWQEQEACLSALQSHSAVIFYRTPLFPSVSLILKEARRLSLTVTWEVDDLIFDESILKGTRSLQCLDLLTYRGILRGARLYKKALLKADAAIASTEALAEEMRSISGLPVTVIHNGIDSETMEIAARLESKKIDAEKRKSAHDSCVIVYGSGTNTHNIDFLETADALRQLLQGRPHLKFRIIGELQLPASYQSLGGQIETYAARSFSDYMSLLSECQISLAPLHAGIFNDSKSNIKWLEAAALGISTVCSPRREFEIAVISGETGFLCDSTMEWERALAALVDDPALRERMGASAKESALGRYGIHNLAQREVKEWYEQTVGVEGSKASDRQSRLLSLNVYYPPQAFGGATLVAHHLNQWLCDSGGVETAVFCLVPDEVACGKEVHRYTIDNVQVFGVPAGLSHSSAQERPETSAPIVLSQFKEVLDAFSPDVIHVHCIQGIGLDVLEMAQMQGIPYVITLHDAWWLCALQFMVTPSGEYCQQSEVEELVCGNCTGQPQFVQARMSRMRGVLQAAESLLAPSEFFVRLFENNGYTNVRLNRNGVVVRSQNSPSEPNRVRCIGTGKKVRYGYVGGNIKIKGFHEIRKVFKRLSHNRDIELILVDNTINLGHSSYFAKDTVGLRNVRVVPAFQQDNIDDFYGQIDVLLFPTRWKESFGLAIREALARGIWVICTDSGGTVEDINDGVNGRIIRFGDDGSDLEQAVLEAEWIVNEWRMNPKSRPNTSIRSCEEQAQELLRIFTEIVENQ